MKRKQFLTITLLTAVLLSSAGVVVAAPPLPGAIFTTDSTCSGVDLNIYTNKDAVYLSGGPAHPGSASLPDGFYFVRVTDPNGDLVLGTSLDGSGIPVPTVQVVSGHFASCYQLSQVVRDPDTLALGYRDTTNPGGEYKVWVSTVQQFDNNSTKTDNFKVRNAPCPDPTNPQCADPKPIRVKGGKVNDINADVIFEPTLVPFNEFRIPGWRVLVCSNAHVCQVVQTLGPCPGPDCGLWSFSTTTEGTYTFEEIIPTGAGGVAGAFWVQSGPDGNNFCPLDPGDGSPLTDFPTLNSNLLDTSILKSFGAATGIPASIGFTVDLVEGDQLEGLRFCNWCRLPNKGLTIGYWSNKNGLGVANQGDLCALAQLNLVNAAGAAVDFGLNAATCNNINSTALTAAQKTALNSFLLSANATNMANMLSAQLAALNNNVRHGLLSGTAFVFGFGDTVANLIIAANATLLAHPITTVVADPINRAAQEILKNYIDGLNNGATVGSSNALADCGVNYAAGQPQVGPLP
jgi:hypothetical protein